MPEENKTENQGGNKTVEGLRTYASDIAYEVALKKGQAIREAIAEEKRILEQKEILSPKSPKNIIYIILGLIFLIGGFIFIIGMMMK